MQKRKGFKVKNILALIMTIIVLVGSVGCGEDATDNNEDLTSISETVVETDLEYEKVLPQEISVDEESELEVYDITESLKNFDYALIPEYSGKAYVIVNDNNPFFTSNDMITESYESYSSLDSKGRCGVCMASVGTDIMPTEDRGAIGDVKPSGWNQAKYAGLVEGNYLYNRCHLIGYQLTGENANVCNLITGTRYLNTDGMLPFENVVADYVKETGNHVIYRVTPVFEGDNLLASGVLMEAKSVEDNGDGILYCVFCYNVQPGVIIDYVDGSSSLSEISVENSQNASSTNTSSNNENELVATPAPPSDSSSDSETETESESETDETVTNDASTGSEAMVWLSETGSKYHSKNDCGNMNPSKATQTTESRAISMGKGKCSKCW